MLKVNEVIVVEGRYDRNALSQVVDAVIIETSGFGIFNDAEKRKLLRKMAESKGLIVLTDSDASGFMIRNHIRGCVDPKLVKHAYIPDIYGRERRKTKASREGKLGVEGMSPEILLESLRKAGASFQEESDNTEKKAISKADMFAKGLSGGVGSSIKRRELLKKLDLPERMTADALLDVLNAIMTRDEFLNMQL